MNVFDVVREPKLTEKTLTLKEGVNQFAFSVDPRANKIQIKESIETHKNHYMNGSTIHELVPLIRQSRSVSER